MRGARGGPFLGRCLHRDITLTIFDHHTIIPTKSSSSCFGFWGLGFGDLGMGLRVVVLEG